jgi:hypothetical protein
MAAGGVKRKRAGADVVPYSRESAKKGRKELEEKREVFLGGLVIEEVEVGEGDGDGEFLLALIRDGPLADGYQVRVSCEGSFRSACTSSQARWWTQGI